MLAPGRLFVVGNSGLCQRCLLMPASGSVHEGPGGSRRGRGEARLAPSSRHGSMDFFDGDGQSESREPGSHSARPPGSPSSLQAHSTASRTGDRSLEAGGPEPSRATRRRRRGKSRGFDSATGPEEPGPRNANAVRIRLTGSIRSTVRTSARGWAGLGSGGSQAVSGVDALQVTNCGRERWMDGWMERMDGWHERAGSSPPPLKEVH